MVKNLAAEFQVMLENMKHRKCLRCGIRHQPPTGKRCKLDLGIHREETINKLSGRVGVLADVDNSDSGENLEEQLPGRFCHKQEIR